MSEYAKWQCVATVAREKGTIMITTSGGCHAIFLGSSMRASLAPGTYTDNLTLAPEVGKEGLLAVVIELSPGKNPPRGGFLLRVSNTIEKGPHIELDKPWMPPADKLARVDPSSLQLEVRVGDQVFTTNPYDKLKPGHRHVPDGNLLCRFLVGEATLEQVEATATAQVEELSALQRVKGLEESVRIWHQEADLLGRQLSAIEALAEKRGDLLDQAKERFDVLRKAFRGVHEAFDLTIWKGRKAKASFSVAMRHLPTNTEERSPWEKGKPDSVEGGTGEEEEI